MGAIDVGLSAVIVAVTDEVPRVVTVRAEHPNGNGAVETVEALPFGSLDPVADRTLELALRRWVRELSDLELGYVEQLYTFGDLYRDVAGLAAGTRALSVAYLALVRQLSGEIGGRARWSDWHGFLPWEDWRGGRPKLLRDHLVPALTAWCASAGGAAQVEARRQRVDIAFGLGGAAWDEERVLDRYELLYEARLVAEAQRDASLAAGAAPTLGGAASAERGEPASPVGPFFGRTMAQDHRRVLAAAMGRLRGKLKYRPVVFELLAPRFTLLSLQRAVEALAGVRLHKQNFRRLVIHGGLVEGTGAMDRLTGGRPAELFEFRKEVLRERPAPGVGLPAAAEVTAGATGRPRSKGRGRGHG